MKTNVPTIFMLIFFCSTAVIGFSQESKIQFHSLSLGLGLIASSSENSGGGLNICGDVTANLDKNLVAVYVNAGAELKLFDASEEYLELNVTYGREISLNDWIKLEGHIGLGYFSHSYRYGFTDFKTITESTIGVPIRLKLLFYTIKHLAFGFNPNLNLNSLVNTYSGIMMLQYKF